MSEAILIYLIYIVLLIGIIVFGMQTDKIINELRRIADGIWRLK